MSGNEPTARRTVAIRSSCVRGRTLRGGRLGLAVAWNLCTTTGRTFQRWWSRSVPGVRCRTEQILIPSLISGSGQNCPFCVPRVAARQSQQRFRSDGKDATRRQELNGEHSLAATRETLLIPICRDLQSEPLSPLNRFAELQLQYADNSRAKPMSIPSKQKSRQLALPASAHSLNLRRGLRRLRLAATANTQEAAEAASEDRN